MLGRCALWEWLVWMGREGERSEGREAVRVLVCLCEAVWVRLLVGVAVHVSVGMGVWVGVVATLGVAVWLVLLRLCCLGV